jgi:hypothetical protein
MSAWPNVYDVSVTADTTVVTTAETVAGSVFVAAVPGPGARVRLIGDMTVTTGASTTALTPRWRRGIDATGVLVGEGNPVTAAAATNNDLSFNVTDTPGEVAGQTYVLTVQATAATANGTVLSASGIAIV